MQAEFDQSLIQDYLEDFAEQNEAIEKAILQLDADPAHVEAARSLFRCVHTVKGNTQFMGLSSVADMVHRLEDLLDDVRNQRRPFSQPISDLILLTMEAVHAICMDIFMGKDVSARVNKLYSHIKSICNAPDDTFVIEAVKALDPKYAASVKEVETAEYVGVDDDVTLFTRLSEAMEQRLVGKKGATGRALEMAIAMNNLAGNIVDNSQLVAAVYMHDVGMAFLPLSLLNKKEKYTETERSRLFHHPQHAVDLLQNLDHWKEASNIILQHHERIDGKGYPANLAGSEICEGAKLMSIIDTFESMSQTRADREHRRSVIRIVAEVNNNMDTQFDAKWVEVFNIYIRRRYLAQK